MLVAIYSVTEMLGGRPLTDRPLNIAEAIIDDDPPAVMRQLYTGVSPIARYDVGADVFLRPHGPMTPLEAATVRDRAGLLELILRQGVPIDAPTRAHLLCLAARAGSKDVLTILEQPGSGPVCGPEADRVLPALPAGGP
jgi:hypothetical protein